MQVHIVYTSVMNIEPSGLRIMSEVYLGIFLLIYTSTTVIKEVVNAIRR